MRLLVIISRAALLIPKAIKEILPVLGTITILVIFIILVNILIALIITSKSELVYIAESRTSIKQL